MHQSISLLLVLLAIISLGHCHGIRPPQVGESCTELVGSRAVRCEEPLAVNETTTPADEMEGFGPNVCVTERMETVSAAEYIVKRFCYGYFCRDFCAKTDNCSVRNISSTVYDCCPGFAAESGSNYGYGYGHYNRHPGYKTLASQGCTIELRESVDECLEELGLSDFATAIEGSSLLDGNDIEGSSALDGDELTIFAPTNDAINGQFLSQTAITTHIVKGLVRNCDLRDGAILLPLNDATLLHVTDVHKYNRYTFEFSEETFINGAQINTSDACLAENGIVHTMNSLIPYSPDSIAELLASENQFSDFVSLLDAANITQFLGADRNTSRTVFAPTNDAFAKLPVGAVECLLRPENKEYAQKLVLVHITAPAEYTSSLAQRSYIKTFYYYKLLVCVINDTIHLTRDNVPLIETDITARNGVIHTLDTVLLSDDIDYDELCPPAEATPPVPVDPSEPGDPQVEPEILP